MNKNELLKLGQIYNTLCLIHVSGEESILMGKSMESLRDFILEKEDELNKQSKE